MLCSCTNKYDIIFEKVEESEESSIDVSETSSTEKIEIKFSADIPSEQFLTSTKDYHSFVSTNQDYVPVHYKTNHTISNVELFKIRLHDDTPSFAKDEVVYTLEKLSPDKHLVASTLIVGTIPQMAISFSDDDGNTYVYSVNTSGKDGSIVLEEIELVVAETSN